MTLVGIRVIFIHAHLEINGLTKHGGVTFLIFIAKCLRLMIFHMHVAVVDIIGYNIYFALFLFRGGIDRTCTIACFHNLMITKQ